MTQPQTIDVTCTACNLTSPYGYEGTVEAALEPDLEQALLDGSLFEHTCPQCGTTFTVVTPFLYKDDTRRLMVNLAPEFKDTAQVEALFEQGGLGDSDISYKDAGYTLRIVGDPNSLREKVLIFKSGLSDRAMEVLKLTIAMMAAEQTGATPQAVLFEGEGDGKLSFCLIGDEPRTVAVDRASYDAIAADLSQDEDDTYYVTPLWAIERYKALASR